jgi:HAD superfamily hydrolase (TIGR01509 family)
MSSSFPEPAARIALVVFDMDGTLTIPYLNFRTIRAAVGMPENGMLLLDWMLTLEGAERERAFAILDEFEDEAARKAELQPGALEMLSILHDRGLRLAVQTRNSRRSVELVFAKFGIVMDEIYTRENAPPKPDPAALRDMMRKYDLAPKQVVMVGDFWADIETGINAGAHTVLLRHDGLNPSHLVPDAEIHSLMELPDVLKQFEVRAVSKF